MWFEELTGFGEESPEQVRANLELDGSVITSKINGRRMQAGRLEIPTLSALREQMPAKPAGNDRLTIEELVGDVQALHTSPEAEGALFQVASQFNLLEMVTPSVTPEDGVSIYSRDPTQGPACAIAAGAGTIFRNYFAPVNGRIGQTADNQIDCLGDIGDILGNRRERLWLMRNGYALASEAGLREIDGRLRDMHDDERDALRRALRIGLQWSTEVTIDRRERLVTQAYCSALPVAYSSHSSELWREFARLILEAAYEATLSAAVINQASTGNRRVYLTLLGGGAFGNAEDWIVSSVRRALNLFSAYPLDVRIVSYGAPNPRVQELL